MMHLSGQRETEKETVDQGLTFLVRLTNDMGLEEVQEYANKLKKAEKMREVREQVCPPPLTFAFLMLFYIHKDKEMNRTKEFMVTVEHNIRNWP